MDEDFDIVLAKNRIARELKTLYKMVKEKGVSIPEYIKKDFDLLEHKTGTCNQPTGRNILESELDI